MKETIEIQAIFMNGKNQNNDYQLFEYEGKVYKVANQDVDKLKTTLLRLSERKEEKIESEFDDFHYDSRVPTGVEPKDYVTVEVLDELKKIFDTLNSSSILNVGMKLDNRIAVKNVMNLPDKFIEWFNNNEKRKVNIKKFLTTKTNINSNQNDNNVSLIGTMQYFTEGTEIHNLYNIEKPVDMLDEAQMCKIIGIKYSYSDGVSNGNIVSFNGENGNIEKVRELEKEFKNMHKDATIYKLIIKRNNTIGLVEPDCLILNKELSDTPKKGV